MEHNNSSLCHGIYKKQKGIFKLVNVIIRHKSMLLDFFKREKLRRMNESLTVDNMFIVLASFSVGESSIFCVLSNISNIEKKLF